MRRLLISGVGLLSALMVLEPALAADQPAQPKRERAAPQRSAPQRTKTFPVATICGTAFGCNTPSGLVSISTRESFHTVRVGLGVDF
jgi:hypothetical protein